MKAVREDLVAAARLGEANAIDHLLIACQPDLKRFARRKCLNSEDAEDAVQFALWQLYRKIGALRTIATLAAWLFRIVERECYRLSRKQPRVEQFDDQQILELAASNVPLDLRLDLSRAIAALPPACREVLIMRDVEEMTAVEVAAHLGLSVDAVKSRLHRSRSLLRERLMTSGYWTKESAEPEGSSIDPQSV